MNIQNVEFLKDQIKYSGFGEGYEGELKEKIAKGLPQFQISHRAEYGTDTVSATLEFSKSKSSDLYFFNSYKIEMKPEGADQTTTQNFKMGTKNNITLKEAFNLLNGRSIYKAFHKLEKQGEGEQARYVPTEQKYYAWKQINFQESTKNGNLKLDSYSENYGFNLQDQLFKLPIRELQDSVASRRLIDSLEKGNRQSVTFLQGSEEVQQFLVANPKFKRIDIYDSNLNKQELAEDKKEHLRAPDVELREKPAQRKGNKKTM